MIEHLVYITKEGVKLWLEPLSKSGYDFKIIVEDPNKKLQTPRFIHIIVEMYIKQTFNSELSNNFVHHMIKMLKSIKPAKTKPIKLQYFESSQISLFDELDKKGIFSVEFILVTTELLAIQQKTRNPNSTYAEDLFHDFIKKDIFSVIDLASQIK